MPNMYPLSWKKLIMLCLVGPGWKNSSEVWKDAYLKKSEKKKKKEENFQVDHRFFCSFYVSSQLLGQFFL